MFLYQKIFWVFLLSLALPVIAFAQVTSPLPYTTNQGQIIVSYEQSQASLASGINLYSQGRWPEAITELRRAQVMAPTKELRGEALFWIAISELSSGQYEESLWDMNALEEADPENFRINELSYHRGRSLYYLGRYNDAIIFFSRYLDLLVRLDSGVLNPADLSRRSSAYYWTAECLYSMGQFDRAEGIFKYVIEQHPESSKYEASVYRLAMINQKKVEIELLGLLQWTHEDALRNTDDYYRKENTYEQAMGDYQRRIADMQSDTRFEELESSNINFREQLERAEDRIRTLEDALRETSSNPDRVRVSDITERLRYMRNSAQELEGIIRGTGQ